MIDILNKFHTDLRFISVDYLSFLFITLIKYRIYNYLFSKSNSFTLIAILLFEVPMWSTRVLVASLGK